MAKCEVCGYQFNIRTTKDEKENNNHIKKSEDKRYYICSCGGRMMGEGDWNGLKDGQVGKVR